MPQLFQNYARPLSGELQRQDHNYAIHKDIILLLVWDIGHKGFWLIQFTCLQGVDLCSWCSPRLCEEQSRRGCFYWYEFHCFCSVLISHKCYKLVPVCCPVWCVRLLPGTCNGCCWGPGISNKYMVYHTRFFRFSFVWMLVWKISSIYFYMTHSSADIYFYMTRSSADSVLMDLCTCLGFHVPWRSDVPLNP